MDMPYRSPSDIRCLCVKCLEDYKNNPNFIVKRLDPFVRVKENATSVRISAMITLSSKEARRGDNGEYFAEEQPSH